MNARLPGTVGTAPEDFVNGLLTAIAEQLGEPMPRCPTRCSARSAHFRGTCSYPTGSVLAFDAHAPGPCPVGWYTITRGWSAAMPRVCASIRPDVPGLHPGTRSYDAGCPR
ncbi:hypothetical protein AB0C77_25450 [Streptomyces sp. NPDC048629]|uniref:hypothetical protein n=1 Tax=Streptomyces sp. NPDC048629 TaxID=3154824 RepID=UPI0034309B02